MIQIATLGFLGRRGAFQHEFWVVWIDFNQDKDFDDPNILDVGHAIRKAKFLNDGLIKLSEFNEDDIGADPLEGESLNTKQRQWLQISKLQQDDKSVYFDQLGMQIEMAKWTYPLHFIDFETSMVAIPFNKGRRPYEGIAFQFSHHRLMPMALLSIRDNSSIPSAVSFLIMNLSVL